MSNYLAAVDIVCNFIMQMASGDCCTKRADRLLPTLAAVIRAAERLSKAYSSEIPVQSFEGGALPPVFFAGLQAASAEFWRRKAQKNRTLLCLSLEMFKSVVRSPHQRMSCNFCHAPKRQDIDHPTRPLRRHSHSGSLTTFRSGLCSGTTTALIRYGGTYRLW